MTKLSEITDVTINLLRKAGYTEDEIEKIKQRRSKELSFLNQSAISTEPRMSYSVEETRRSLLRRMLAIYG